MQPSVFGEAVASAWDEIPIHFPAVQLDASVVMPNHVHGIIVIGARVSVRATHASPVPRGPRRSSLGAIVGSFKSAAAKRINTARGTPGAPVWHRGYYEHIVRHEDVLHRIRRYIAENPARWRADILNPLNCTSERL
jgi:REP element-mobilizing transposase RayT